MYCPMSMGIPGCVPPAPASPRLEVSALLAQGIEDERTQFSVVLLPNRTPGEEINDPTTTSTG